MRDYHYQPQEKVSKGERMARNFAIIMTIAFIITLVWGIWQYNRSQQVGALLENEYQRSFYTLVDGTQQLSLTTGKILASGGRQNNALFREMQSQAESVLNSLNTLPLEGYAMTRTSQYFNQVADYAGSLLQGINDGNALPDEDYAAIKTIHGEMKELGEILSRLEEQTGSGAICFNVSSAPLDKGILAVAARQEETPGPATAMTYFDEVNDKLSLLDALEYEGDYSSHMREPEPKSLVPGADIGKNEALAIAKEFAALITKEELEFSGEEEIGAKTTLPAYAFAFNLGEDNLRITVSKSGGKVLSAYYSRNAGEAVLSNEEGLEKAEAFLSAAGYGSMELISQEKDNNRLILCYARLEEEVLYYPDCVQITVALDNGDILLFQAREYWMNFDENRELPAEAMEVSQAQMGMNQGMEVSGNRKALIAGAGGKEIFCYEFRGTIGEDEYLVYLDSEGGLEEQILCCYTGEDGFYTR